MFARSATEVEATRLACHAALAEGVGVCLAGGTHHAFRGHGEGYCVFNDVAVAIRDLQDKQPNIRIMVVDTDAHQGNGTAALLANDPRVFTYSIHVGRNYPTKKTTGTLDIETVRYVEGEMYLHQLFTSLANALDAFAPDLVIWISGADNHRNDRFGQMHLSLKDIQRRDEVLLGAFIRNRIPVAVLYGGGYNRQPEFTAKLHRNTVATAKKFAARIPRAVIHAGTGCRHQPLNPMSMRRRRLSSGVRVFDSCQTWRIHRFYVRLMAHWSWENPAKP